MVCQAASVSVAGTFTGSLNSGQCEGSGVLSRVDHQKISVFTVYAESMEIKTSESTA